jgi:hypothetical protein
MYAALLTAIVTGISANFDVRQTTIIRA